MPTLTRLRQTDEGSVGRVGASAAAVWAGAERGRELGETQHVGGVRAIGYGHRVIAAAVVSRKYCAWV